VCSSPAVNAVSVTVTAVPSAVSSASSLERHSPAAPQITSPEDDEHTTSATSAITNGGTPAKGDKLYLRVYRDADAGGDTLGADAHLTGITVKFGMGQYDDQ
jgi:hypothetical protein